MKHKLIPDFRLGSLLHLTPEHLKERGISLLMLDLDNTIAPYGEHRARQEVRQWAERMRQAGIRLFIVSNSHKEHRVRQFAEDLGAGHVLRAKKPSKRMIEHVLSREGKQPHEAAICGDQVYTDALGGNRAGVTTFAVRPIRLKNPLLAVRYALELPFRALCRRKIGPKQ